MAYTGLPDKLRAEVFARDSQRCRWCGVTNRGLDIHHIEYRRGISYDRLDNLISLCRTHHSFVHGVSTGQLQIQITKPVAQMVLWKVLQSPGRTGSSVWRSLKKSWTAEGYCIKHGSDTCSECDTL